MSNKSLFRYLICVFLLCVGMWSCTSPDPSPNTAVVGLRGDVDSFNELNAADSDALQMIKHLLFLSLMRLNEDLEHVPYLATSWEVSDDGRQVTFFLRNDVQWSDGEPTTADDVLFTYRTMTDPEVAYPAVSRFDLVDRAEKLDDFTVRFVLTQPYPNMLFDLNFPILPQHILGPLSPDERLTSSFNRKPVSNGPFVPHEWQANRAIVFHAFEQFALEKPRLERLIFSIIPDENVLLANLRNQTVDVVPRVSPDQLNSIQSDPHIRITSFEGKRFTFVGWNTARPLFSTLVRRALTHAINKQEIISTLLNGYGQPAIGPLTSMAWAYDSTLQDISYNPERARELLAEAGWIDRDADGTLENNDKEFEFTLKINIGSQQRQDVAVLVQSQLAAIGVRVRIERVEWNLFIDQVFGQKEFDAVVLTWDSNFTVDPKPLWHSKAITKGYNFVSYRNPKVDSLISAARYTASRELALPLWSEFQQIVINDCPYTFLFIPDEIIAYNRRLRGTEFDVRGFLTNSWQWSIEE